MRAVDFLFRQFNQPAQMPLVPILQERIEQHRAKCWGEGQRQTCFHAVVRPAFHDLEERHVGFGDGFEQPRLFQKLFVLGMADERQVRVENE
jgi:hypothetical protein